VPDPLRQRRQTPSAIGWTLLWRSVLALALVIAAVVSLVELVVHASA
jgi:hypothetical protein